jgi:hypothetical protein
MHVSLATNEFNLAGFTMLARVGCLTWSDPGPWHFSQPTFHSVTVLVWIL